MDQTSSDEQPKKDMHLISDGEQGHEPKETCKCKPYMRLVGKDRIWIHRRLQ